MEANGSHKAAECYVRKRFWQRQGSGVRNTAGVERAKEETETQRSQKMGHGWMGLFMLGQRQVVPRWANDPVWLHIGSRQESGQGRVRAPPPEGNKAEGREGRIGLIIMEYLRKN